MEDLGLDACMHCGICRRSCPFLAKYGIVIGDVERLEELAYHCFLCGTCTRVCPEGIDGRHAVLSLRRKRVSESGGRLPEKGYAQVLIEKQNYLFKNYRRAAGQTVFFPGCSFPSFYPRTTRHLMERLEARGIGTVFDCCGKPLSELGLVKEEENLLARLKESLDRYGIRRIAVVCPNCYHYLKSRLAVEVVSVYAACEDLGIADQAAIEGDLFLPCPDRDSLEFFETIPISKDSRVRTAHEIPCCGAGGCASVREPDLASAMAGGLETPPETPLYSYCATCAGVFARSGRRNAKHLMSELLGIHEEPATKTSLLNRMKAKLI